MEQYKIVNGVSVRMTPEEIQAHEDQSIANAAILAEVKYIQDRATSYPSIQAQLDKIYHEGIDAWKAEIKSVKDRFPKPTKQ